MNAPTSSMLQAIVSFSQDASPATFESVARAFESAGISDSLQVLQRLQRAGLTSERIGTLMTELGRPPGMDAKAVGVALRACRHALETVRREQAVEIAWTGPTTEAQPFRRVDQALYELIESASHEVLLVTYAAYKADRALEALKAACERGANLTLVLELASDSGGKLAFDTQERIRTALPSARIYYWPLDQRHLSAAGKHGAMHVKCAVVDRRRALVSSANLTDYALEMNMELGLVVSGSVAAQIAGHFDHLIARRILVPSDATGW